MPLRNVFQNGMSVLSVTLAMLVGVTTAPTARAQSSTACSKSDVITLQEYPGVTTNLIAWVAVEHGFFKKHCLQAKMANYPSATTALAASLQGGLDFLSLSPDVTYVAASKGFDLKIVAFQGDTVHYALVVGKHVPLPRMKDGYPEVMKDLLGKKIGVNALGSTTDILARAHFMGAGLDPNQANWIAYGPPAAGIAGLQNGSLDAVEFFGDGMDTAVAATGGVIVGDLRDPNTKADPKIMAMRGAHSMWVASTAFVKKNSDVVRRFSLANNEAADWIKNPKNFDAVLKIVREKSPSPAAVADPEKLLRERVTRWIPQVNSQARMRALKAWSDWDVAINRIPKPADIDGLLWETARAKTIP